MKNVRNVYFITKILFCSSNLKIFQNFQKTVTHVLEGALRSMCTQFKVDTFENDVCIIAFKTSKMATFHDFSMHYQAISFFCFYTLFYAPNVVLGSFFELRTIKQPKNMYREVK